MIRKMKTYRYRCGGITIEANKAFSELTPAQLSRLTAAIMAICHETLAEQKYTSPQKKTVCFSMTLR